MWAEMKYVMDLGRILLLMLGFCLTLLVAKDGCEPWYLHPLFNSCNIS